MMRKSKCRWCVEGMVLDDTCDDLIGHCYCDIDNYDPDVGCNRNCSYYECTDEENEGETK